MTILNAAHSSICVAAEEDRILCSHDSREHEREDEAEGGGGNTSNGRDTIFITVLKGHYEYEETMTSGNCQPRRSQVPLIRFTDTVKSAYKIHRHS